MTLPLNHALANLPVYQPGRPIEEVARELGLPVESIIKLASNENPLGPSPAALAAIERALQRLHLYPDGNAFYLKEKLARHLQVQPANLILGNGSNEIIEFVGHALLRPGTNIVVSQYCFAIYPIVARLFGADVLVAPARDYGHDPEAMLSLINERTSAIFVANPNNPTGTLLEAAQVRQIVEKVPENVLLVMDEAYLEFLDQPTDLLPLIRAGTRNNLLLMRTFSKIYGLAGLRIGYGVGAAGLVGALEKIRQPFNITSPAQVGALAALEDTEHVARTRQNNRDGRAYLEKELRKLNLEVVPSAANFLLAHVGDGARIFQLLQEHGVIVRPMHGYQLPEWIRISVGTPAENARCIEVLARVLDQER